MTELTEQEWKRNNDSVLWVDNNRDRIEEAADVTIPGRLHKIDEWLTDHAAVVTRRLSDTDTDTDTEDE